MSSFEHLLVLVSIVLGMALTEILSSLHHLVMARERVRFHWLPLTWALFVFVATTQYWWAFFQAGQDPVWTQFFAFLFVLLELTCLYLIASIALPDIDGTGETVDLVGHYFRNRHWFFGLIGVYVTLAVVDRIIRGNPVIDPGHAFNAVGILAAALLMKSRSFKVHAVATCLLATGFFVFVARYTLWIE